MTDDALTKEVRILRAVKLTLTKVIKDTATPPGLRHPLSDSTIEDLRNCLILISRREQELAELTGRPMTDRPRFVDEPNRDGAAEIAIEDIQRKKPS